MLDGAEEVVPLALMALGLDPNTDSASDFAKVKKFLLKVRPGVTTIDSSGYINDSIAGKIILSQGWNGDVRRIVQARKKQGDITPVIPTGDVRGVGRQLVHPGQRAAPGGRARLDQLAARAGHRGGRDELPQLQDPDAGGARPDARRASRTTRSSTCPKSYTDNYKYILNVSPSVVNQRTQIYGEFKAA